MTTGNEPASGARTMKASEFKAKCLKLMDEVAQTAMKSSSPRTVSP